MRTQTIAARCVKSERYRKWPFVPFGPVHNPFLILFVSGFFFCFSGLHAQNYSYKFAVEGISDPAGAKMITDVLRPVFNHPETPYTVFPAFDDVSDMFVFSSDLAVTREELAVFLTPDGLVILSFQMIAADGKVEPTSAGQ